MWLLLVSVYLAIFSSPLTSASEPHYVVVIPANLEHGTEEKACVTFLDLKGEVNLKIELKHDDQVLPVAEEKINTHDHSECYAFQAPIIQEDRSVWHLHVSAHGEHINVDDSKKFVIFKKDEICIIRTDKSTYKPGDTVKFQLVTMNTDLQAINQKYPLVEIQNQNNQRIAQWLDVYTTQGFAEFSFPLAHELAYGRYKINIPDGCMISFEVNKYVPQRFELNIKIPFDVGLTDKSFRLDACGSYTYGKPVEGVIDLSVCAEKYYPLRRYEEETDKRNCITIKGEKTDSKGCVSREIELAQFDFTTTVESQYLEIKSELTEDGTGHSEKASVDVHPSHKRNTVEFVECENLYQKGLPYHGKVKVSDEKNQPVPKQVVNLEVQYEDDDGPCLKLLTDSDGIAQFTLNTSDWQPYTTFLVAQLSAGEDSCEHKIYALSESAHEAWLDLFPLISKSESTLSIQRHSKDVSCNSEQSVTVEYDVSKKNLESDTDHLHFFYILLTKSGIVSYKEHKVDTKDQANSPNLHGSFPLNFHIDEDFFPLCKLLVFSVLPNGKTIAMATDFNVSPCVPIKMKLSFSKEEVRPGETVDLEVTADPGSLCSVRSVDKGYLLKNPYEDHYMLTDMTVHLRNYINAYQFTQLIVDPDVNRCPENTSSVTNDNFDVYKLFLVNNLQILTNTEIMTPLKCVPVGPSARQHTTKKTESKDKKTLNHFTRSYFPDTWFFKLASVSSDGHSVLHLTTPHTITKWVTDGFCLSKTGYASVKNVELTTFQPYFIDLIVPYSVVQGEAFKIQAVVFSYGKKCNLISVSLSKSEDLITAQDKEQHKCVCEGHSHTFSWDVSALKPKALKLHVDSGSIEVEGDCTQNDLVIGDDHRKDSVEKTVVVKPKGHEEEKAKTFLLLPSDNREAIHFNIDVPERLVPGSEHAHVIIQGEILSNFMSNIDRPINMPDGCGEQNAAKMFRYVCLLNYLESTQKLTPKIKAKLTESLVKGYQKQLTFKTEGEAYAFFLGSEPNVWLTAMTVSAYSGAQKYIYINEKHIQEIWNWLQTLQKSNGCFAYVGDYYNNYERADDIKRTAYVTVALLEHNVAYNGSLLEDALSCLRKSADSVTSIRTQALLAYAFTLSGDHDLREQILKKLDETAIRKDGMMHWETGLYGVGLVEMSAYVALALLSEKKPTNKNLEDSENIMRWMVTYQNLRGGYTSSQDTTIALQAMAKFAEAIKHKEGDATVTITSNSGFQKIVHVDKNNNLLVQTVDLPDIPGNYTISVTGDGLVYAQSHLYYYALPDRTEKGHFPFHISTEPSTCSRVSQQRFNVHMDVGYAGKREETNMAIIVVDHVSGYVPDEDTVEEMKKHPLVEKTEISAQNLTIYLKKLTHKTVNLNFSMEREAHVENLQPANVLVYDYYDPVERTSGDYNPPCYSVVAHCAMSATEREDCGFPNISKEQCEQKDCCFDNSIHGTKWCFHHGFKETENN
ncbi:alpha-2-macroglobulin-like protein 1 [Eleutherodactylus coqui]|uniref:alpha-2-macroglobulin-like protein 1 n=1 Tax=Eleutherodactylus coqui TaxID=57060 RepID=UPI0034634E15